jgi:hypothetical protein
LVNLISKTWRIKIIGKIPKENGIIVFWHGLMLPCWKFFSKLNPYAVVSTSKDGQVLVKILSKWNYSFIRGSSSKGGKVVLENIISLSKDKLVLMTPDGPRGPNRKFKAGALVAAQRSQADLFYLRVKINSKIILKKSWDKFEFPLPFSKINIEVSEPLNVHNSLSREEIERIISEIEIKMK